MEPEAPAEKRIMPLVPYLRIPDNYPEEPAYLWGSRCRACGTVHLGSRVACVKCASSGPFEETRFSGDGEIYVFSVVHQSIPGVEAPYVAAIIDLPEGASVRGNVYGLDPLNPTPEWLGKKVKMYTEKVRADKEGNDIVAAKFRVAE